jgi:CYTH domain-containing protein
LEGLVIGEIEFDFKEQSGDFEPPDWMGNEITGDQRYAGQSLALHDQRYRDAGRQLAQSRDAEVKA